jgi:SAM-dependent methyltransferase
MLINSSISGQSKNLGEVVSKTEWKNSELFEFFSVYFRQISGEVQLRKRDLKEYISDLIIGGNREIYVWDEMSKMSEMAYIHSRAPLIRPIIDLCCGYGYWISKILCQIDLGIDLFPKNGRYKRKIEGFRLRNFMDDTYKAVLRYDVTKMLPIPEASIGTVLSICSLEHIRDHKAVLHEIRRILKSDGRLILTVDAPLLIEVLEEVFSHTYCEKFKQEHQLETLLSFQQWKQVLNETGFELEDATGYIDRMQTFLYLITFYPSDFTSYWTRLGFTEIFRENDDVRHIWNNKILPSLTTPTDPMNSMLICIKAKPSE